MEVKPSKGGVVSVHNNSRKVGLASVLSKRRRGLLASESSSQYLFKFYECYKGEISIILLLRLIKHSVYFLVLQTQINQTKTRRYC